MRIAEYEMTNWGPHLHRKLVFPPEAKTIAICGENDQGKSWILRGLGFTLSIGKNEYGDQTSIHVGETVATHRLVIEHKGVRHTIEKIVRGKESDEEGTETRINGKESKRADIEEFYTKTLAISLPAIWLPIVCSMQNETDYHLRSKKSIREEALRGPCQLHRIDNWKEALLAKTNTEDKSLIAEMAALKSQLDALKRENDRVETEKARLSKIKEELTAGDGTATLTEILAKVEDFQKAETEIKQRQLEADTLTRDAGLEEKACGRIQTELKGIPGTDPETEAAWDATQKSLAGEAQARMKTNTMRELRATLSEMRETTAEIQKLGAKPDTKELEKIEEAIRQTRERKSEAARLGKELADCLRACDLPIETERETLEKEKREAERKSTECQEIKSRWESRQAEEARLRETIAAASQCNPEDRKKTEQALKTCIEENTPGGTGPILDPEAQTLLKRLLEHWETHPQETCPVCSQSLKGIPLFEKPAAREKLLAGITTPERNPRMARTAEHALESLPKWDEERRELIRLKEKIEAEWAITEDIQANLEKTLKRLAQRETLLEQAKRALDTEKTARALLANALTTLEESAGTKEIEAAEGHVTKARETIKRWETLEARQATLSKDHDRLGALLETLEDAGDPDPKLAELSKEEIQTQLQTLTERLTTARKNRTARIEKEKELEKAKAKLEEFQRQQKRCAQQLEEARARAETGAGMPKLHPEDSWQATAQEWEKRGEEIRRIDTLLEQIPKETTRIQTESTATEKAIAETNHLVRRAEAARKLIAFLDYKKAPRQLLQTITSQIFAGANRIAEHLQVGIRLEVGKNLEFLCHQYRKGKWIEQKTERIGFGKGAMLGICFRLAARKILLPDIGFLLLDEPTANVDIKRKGALKAFLQNLGEETESGIEQVILIEHDTDVIELAHKKITISEREGEP